MRITILGHASVLVETDATRLLVDPVFADTFGSGAVRFAPGRHIDAGAMPVPTAIAITHSHLDHWHAPTIAGFARTTPVLIPPDPWLAGRLDDLGFTAVTVLEPWATRQVGDLHLQATPSDIDIDEFGLVLTEGEARYWHVSDCFVRSTDAARIAADGPITVAAARYQPGNALVSYQRNLGWAHDERAEVAEWLEAVCDTDPVLVFPYFWGVAYDGAHAWANRYVAPYTPAAVARLLDRRLAGHARVAEVTPGDVITATSRSEVTVERGAAGWVQPATVDHDPWEPVDTTTLTGVDPADRDEVRQRLEAWFRAAFGPWLTAALVEPGHPIGALVAWGVRWQVVVHVGDGERVAYRADFGGDGVLRAGPDPDADLTVHLAGGALLDVLRGEAGAELFWLAGAARTHERILTVVDGRISPPPLRGWELAEQVPEPLTWCLRTVGVPAG